MGVLVDCPLRFSLCGGINSFRIARLRFELQGGMFNPKPGEKSSLDLGAQACVTGFKIIHSDMRAQCNMTGANIPDVQIVDIQDPHDLSHCMLDLCQGYAFWHAFDQDMERFASYPVGTEGDQEADEYTDQGIDPLPTGEANDNCCQDNAQRRNRIANNMQECAVDIQIFNRVVMLSLSVRVTS